MKYQPTKQLAEMGKRFRWQTSVDLTRMAAGCGLRPVLPRRPIRPALRSRCGNRMAAACQGNVRHPTKR